MKIKLYEKTAARLARAGVKDPTAQIIALAEEIEGYRIRIHGLEARLAAPPKRAEGDPVLVCPVCGRDCSLE